MSISVAAVNPPTTTTTRKRLTPAKEKIIAAAQDYKCAICRVILPSTWELDHKIELWQGGTNELDNFQVLCPNCHRKKTQLAAIAREDLKRSSVGTSAAAAGGTCVGIPAPGTTTSPHFQVVEAVTNPKPIPPFVQRRQKQHRPWGSFFCCGDNSDQVKT